MRRPFQQGDEIVVTPARLGKRGEAEAEHEGWRVRVRGGLPGEAAHVRIEHVSKGGPVAVARFERPAGKAHPGRREPPCPIHEKCGGCGLQHLGETPALALKVAQAQALLPGPWRDPIPSPRAFGYRAKTFLLPQRVGPALRLGARPPRGSRLVDTTGCNVLRPELEALAARVREALRGRADLAKILRAVLLRCNRAGETQATLVHRGPWRCDVDFETDSLFLQRHDEPGNRVHSDESEVRLRGKPLLERYAGLASVVPPTAFHQANPEVAEALYEAAAEAAAGRRVAELYCGAAVAGLLAARKGASLLAVDRAPRSIAAARATARKNGLRARFEVAPAEKTPLDCDAVLVNPPRAGCGEAVLDAVARSGAERLVYLSCNPATLARDAERLGWTVESLRAADMLPQTPHLEVLAVFTRP